MKPRPRFVLKGRPRKTTTLPPAIVALIRTLAAQAVKGHLESQTQPAQADNSALPPAA